ncbi:MAG: glycosyltransferase family 9 protein [Pirellulales bacterium]|nr:glycosyltransferase family 9 protein [Pirellulales bacterium]
MVFVAGQAEKKRRLAQFDTIEKEIGMAGYHSLFPGGWGAAGGGKLTAPAGPAVLVIFAAALGDLAVFAPGLQKVREKHEDANLVLLSRSEKGAGHLIPSLIRVDECVMDPCPRRPPEFLKFIRRLRDYNFTDIYHLHETDRTLFYCLFLPRRGQHRRSGRTILASLLTRSVAREPKGRLGRPHDRARRFWRGCGIEAGARLDMSAIPALTPEVRAALPAGDFALVVPGSGLLSRRGESEWPPASTKRWPSRYFGEIARRLEGEGVRPVVIGVEGDRYALEDIRAVCPAAVDFLGKTTPFDMIHLGVRARVMVTNDTGPVHWASMGGVRSVSLFGSDVSPEVWAARGTIALERDPLALLEPGRVWSAVKQQLEKSDD